MAIKLHSSFAIHPGPFLMEEFVRPYGLTVKETAERLGVTRAPMSNLLNGKASLSPEMAVRFEKAFGVSGATLMKMQAAYDIVQARKAASKIKVERIPAEMAT